MLRPLALAALLLVPLPALAASDGEEAMSGSPIVLVPTERSVSAAMDALEAAVVEAGAIVVARVNHAANAEGTGTELRPLQKLIFGNPALGSPVMAADQRAALLLPQMVIAFENSEGQVVLGYLDPAPAMAALGIDVHAEELATMRGALERLTAAAAG